MRQVGRLLPGVGNAAQVVAGRVVRGQACLRQLGQGQDHGEEVVEVVGDAAGEPADQVQALGALQGGLALEPGFLRLPQGREILEHPHGGIVLAQPC